MINGITILNEEVCNKGTTLGHIFFAILFILSVLAGIAILIESIKDGSLELLWCLIPVIIFSALMFGAAMVTPEHLNDSYTKYEVTISGDVSMKEFTDKYSIIGQRGDIYVIRDKDND